MYFHKLLTALALAFLAAAVPIDDDASVSGVTVFSGTQEGNAANIVPSRVEPPAGGPTVNISFIANGDVADDKKYVTKLFTNHQRKGGWFGIPEDALGHCGNNHWDENSPEKGPSSIQQFMTGYRYHCTHYELFDCKIEEHDKHTDLTWGALKLGPFPDVMFIEDLGMLDMPWGKRPHRGWDDAIRSSYCRKF